MESPINQEELNKELLRECQGYTTRDNKPDGAYIQVGEWFYNINKIKRLIASGANINAKGSDDRTPLYWSVWMDNIELAKLLIALSADVSMPLYCAYSQKMKALLKKHGAE